MAGWTSETVVSRSATLGFEGQFVVNEATGTKDAGQLIVEEAGHNFGQESLRWFRVQALNTARTTVIGHIIVQASVTLGEGGGGMEDISPFAAECAVQGAPIGSGIYSSFNIA